MFQNAFKPAMLMLTMMAKAMPINPGITRFMSFEAAGGHEYRGKGEGNRKPAGANMAFKRAAKKARNVAKHRKASR